MNQQQMHKLLDVPERTLRDWKMGKEKKTLPAFGEFGF